MPLRLVLAAIVAALPIAAAATPQQRDATDMWFNPAESGWGLNVIHQGGTLFATLFVYGQDGQPRWYVASSMSGGPDAYSGTLYEQTGPGYSLASFDASSVTRRAVGSITLAVGDTGGTLDYTVDNVHVTKPVTRFSFRPLTVNGVHRGVAIQPSGAGAAPFRHDFESARITDNGADYRMDTTSDAEPSCSYFGARGQDGQLESASGTFACGLNGNAGSGNWSMRFDPTPNGIIGSFSGNGIAPSGRIALARAAPPQLEGTGWRNGIWFNPNESGWGLNLIEQGDAMFGTLFVYDSQGKPRWYVASQMSLSGTTGNGTALNSGTLYESSGPYFGAGSFNPSASTRRAVGTISFQVQGPGFAVVTYSVDGVQVTKNVTNFAFRQNDPSGAYVGYLAGVDGGKDPAQLTINQSGSGFTMRIAGMYGGTCDYTGSSVQVGSSINASGSVQCGTNGSATFRLENLTVGFNGVTGHLELDNVNGFVQEGLRSFNIAGARTS